MYTMTHVMMLFDGLFIQGKYTRTIRIQHTQAIHQPSHTCTHHHIHTPQYTFPPSYLWVIYNVDHQTEITLGSESCTPLLRYTSPQAVDVEPCLTQVREGGYEYGERTWYWWGCDVWGWVGIVQLLMCMWGVDDVWMCICMDDVCMDDVCVYG